MAGVSYPPWSAPTTMERKNKPKSKKWTNVKRAFKKPWQKRPPTRERSRPVKDRSALPPPAGLDETSFRQMQFGEFSPFGQGRQKINPLSGGGNPFLFHQLTGGAAFPNYHPMSRMPYSEEVSPYEKRRENEVPDGYFDPPTLKSSRPALANIFPMYDSPKVQKTPPAASIQQKKAAVSTKAPSVVKPAQPSNLLMYERRGSTPAASGLPPNALKSRHLHMPAQSTTSDITDERMGRKERVRRASAIKILPLLPPVERSPPVVHGETQQDSDCEDDDTPSHAMYHTPANFAHSDSNGLLDSTGMYGWLQQPNEQLQKLEEELEEEEPEGKEEDTRTRSWERERENKLVADSKKGVKSKKKKKSSKKATKGEKEVTDFAQEFVRQLTIGGNEADVLY